MAILKGNLLISRQDGKSAEEILALILIPFAGLNLLLHHHEKVEQKITDGVDQHRPDHSTGFNHTFR